VAPLLEPLAVDRAPYLFGTGCPNLTLVFVKPQATIVKSDPKIIEHSANLEFGLGHQILMDHAMDPARSDHIEMGQHADVIRIETADVVQVIGKLLARRKKLPVV